MVTILSVCLCLVSIRSYTKQRFTPFRTKTFIAVLYPYRDIGAYVDLLNVIKSTAASESIPQSTVSTMALQSDAVFEAIKERVNADKAKAKAVNGVFLYKITVDGKIIKEWSKQNF